MGKFKAKIGDRVILSDRALKSHRTAFGTRTGVIELLQVIQHRTTYVAKFPAVSRKINSRVGLFSHEFNTIK
jgi:hypothetical protein